MIRPVSTSTDGRAAVAGRDIPDHPTPSRLPVSGRHVRMWLLSVLVVLGACTAAYVVVEGWSVGDGLYMTVISLTTVGFKEVRDLDESGRIITMLASISGVALIFGGVSIIAENLVSDLTSGERERRRMQQRIAAASGHFLLCGYGRVGATVARELREAGERVVVVDVREDSLARAERDGFLVVEGDATEDQTLRQAGIERARTLITTIDSDANNVYVILSARAINAELFLVGRANAEGSEAKLFQAGADRAVSPYTMAGHRIAELATRPRVVDFIDAALSRGELAFAIEELQIVAGDPLEGRTVGQLRDEGIHALAVVEGEGRYEANPLPDRRITAGDGLIVSGAAGRLRELRG